MEGKQMLLCEGEEVTYNLKDALEVLTETEAIMLDMLVSKVKDHTEQKQKAKVEEILNELKNLFDPTQGVKKHIILYVMEE